MGAGLQPGGALGNRRARRRSSQPMSEINVTPFVDVMLVLLIIFMVTAPLLTVGVDIDAKAGPEIELPKTEAGPVAPEEAPLSITVDASGKIFIQNTEIGFDELVPKLNAIREAGGGAQVWVRGDKSTSYGNVAKVLVRIKEAGLPVTLVTDPLDQL
jgi:biopolymer transport protein TolR